MAKVLDNEARIATSNNMTNEERLNRVHQLKAIEKDVNRKQLILKDYILSNQFKEISIIEENYNKIREYNEKASQFLTKLIESSKNKEINNILYETQDFIHNPHENIVRRYSNYIPLKENAYAEDSLQIFYPNFGEHFFEKIQMNWNLLHEDLMLRNDFAQDEILYEFLSRHGENDDNIKTYIKYRGKTCSSQAVRQRFEKFASQIEKKSVKFRQNGCSVRIEEPMDHHTIQKTHKELFCRRCQRYDCQTHGIMEFSTFISAKKFAKNEMKESFEKMISKHLSFKQITNLEHNSYKSSNHEPSTSNNLKSIQGNISGRLNGSTKGTLLTTKTLIESNFNHHESKESQDNVSNISNILKKDLLSNIKPCGPTCYLSYTHTIKSPNNWNSREKTWTKDKLDFYYSKITLGVEIFKFDPCHIRLFFNDDEIACYDIFDYILKDYMKIISKLNLEETPISIPNSTDNIHHHQQNAIVNCKKNRKSSTNSKKRNYLPNWKNVFSNTRANYGKSYVPCYHHFFDKIVPIEEQTCKHEKCPCYDRGFCDKYCGCSEGKCQIMRKGCQCQSNCLGQKCFCYSINSECDPDLCKGCFNTVDGNKKKNSCQNNFIYFGKNKRCLVGKSNVCAELGLYCVSSIEKGELVYVYIGEVISWEEAELREKWNEFDNELYLFTVTDQFVIDAKFKGNKARFINHSKSPNIVARTVFSRGEYHCAFYALENIEPGMELLFDYDGTNTLWEKFPWIKNTKNNNNKKQKQKQKQEVNDINNDYQVQKYKELVHNLVPRKVRITFNTSHKIKEVIHVLQIHKRKKKNMEIEKKKDSYDTDKNDLKDNEEFDSDFGYLLNDSL